MVKRNLKSFCLGLILTFLLFIPSLMADTASQVFDKTPLDHSWRKGELRSAPVTERNCFWMGDICHHNDHNNESPSISGNRCAQLHY